MKIVTVSELCSDRAVHIRREAMTVIIAAAAFALITPNLCTTPRLHYARTSISLLAPDDEPDERPQFSDLQPLQPLSNRAAKSNGGAESSRGLDPSSWEGIGAGIALYILLYTSTLSVLQLASAGGATNGLATATARLIATGGFAAIQQAAGLPIEDWLTLQPSSTQKSGDDAPGSALPSFLLSPIGPPAAGLAFFLVAAGLGVAASLGAGLEWDSTLPAGRALPEIGAAADILLVAPITEEIFFRGWLLRATEKANLSQSLRIGASALLFAVWHVGAGDSPLFFAGLGAYLAYLHQRSDGSLGLCIGTHATYNLAITLLRAVRA